MRGPHTEYILKGIFLGLWLFIALNVPDVRVLGYATACTFGGLLLSLLIAAAIKFARGYRVAGKPLAFLLFLLLESPYLLYTGVLVGTAGGALLVRYFTQTEENWQLLYFTAGGAAGGALFGMIRQVQHRLYRLVMTLALAALLVVGG